TSRHLLRNTNTIRAGNVWCSTTQRGTSTEILIGGRNLASIVLWSPNCHSKTAAAIFSLAAAAGWTSRTSTCLLPFSSMLSARVTGVSLASSSRRRWKHCSSGMYSRVSSMLRGSGRMIQRVATTTGSLPLSKSLLHTLLKRVSVSRRKVASFLAGTRYQPGRLTEFCRKRSLCFRSIAASWSGNLAFSIKEIPRDSCSSTWVGTHRYSGDDSQSGSGTQAHIPSDDKRRAQLRFHPHSRRPAAAATSVCATAQFRQSLFFGQSCAFLDKLSDIFGVSPNSAPTAFDFAIRLGSSTAD